MCPADCSTNYQNSWPYDLHRCLNSASRLALHMSVLHNTRPLTQIHRGAVEAQMAAVALPVFGAHIDWITDQRVQSSSGGHEMFLEAQSADWALYPACSVGKQDVMLISMRVFQATMCEQRDLWLIMRILVKRKSIYISPQRVGLCSWWFTVLHWRRSLHAEDSSNSRIHK